MLTEIIQKCLLDANEIIKKNDISFVVLREQTITKTPNIFSSDGLPGHFYFDGVIDSVNIC